MSGIFLEELHTAFAEECENITGASLTARVSCAVCIELWERSTIIPKRFISSTTVWNKKVYIYIYIYIFSQFYNCMYQNILAKKEWSLHSITTNFLTTCSTFLISFAAPQSKTKILRVFEYVYYYLIGKQWKQFHIMWGPTVNSMLYSEIWTSNNLFAPIFLKRCWCSFLSQIIVLS